ncbi:DUF882 domain-containing protein [bacterium]|nr:DUF882 domain-containing protein [bacterium]
MGLLDTRIIGVKTRDVKIGNFYPEEFACKCCGKVMILSDLWQAIQLIRNTAMRPVIINSAYRCPPHNAEIGGSEGSDHIHGFAADIHVPGLTADEVGEIAARLSETIKRIGVYMNQDFVHIGVRNRGPGTWRAWRYDETGELSYIKPEQVTE